jgi:hypothetical protein
MDISLKNREHHPNGIRILLNVESCGLFCEWWWLKAKEYDNSQLILLQR